MSKIEWERQPDGILAGHADFVRYQAYEGEQETWQRIHDARVATIAAANGYVKSAPITIDCRCNRCGGSGVQFFDPDAICKDCGGHKTIPVKTAAPIPDGYVKADDYEALKAKLAEVTDQLDDATDALDLIESEAHLFDATAITSGYVKLEPGQVVVQVEDLTRIVTWFRGDARTVPHADMDTTLNRFTAAIDASGVGR